MGCEIHCGEMVCDDGEEYGIRECLEWTEVDGEMSCVVSRVTVGGRGKREDEGRRCGEEFGAECRCTG